MPSQFEWDEEKDQANRAKHGIGFEEAKARCSRPQMNARITAKSVSSALANSARWLLSSFTRAAAGESG